MDKKRLNQTINDLKLIIEENGLEVSDNTIFEQSCAFERGELVGQSKKNSNIPTEKQIAFFKKNDLKINPYMTKQEASQIISEFKDKIQ